MSHKSNSESVSGFKLLLILEILFLSPLVSISTEVAGSSETERSGSEENADLFVLVSSEKISLSESLSVSGVERTFSSSNPARVFFSFFAVF